MIREQTSLGSFNIACSDIYWAISCNLVRVLAGCARGFLFNYGSPNREALMTNNDQLIELAGLRLCVLNGNDPSDRPWFDHCGTNLYFAKKKVAEHLKSNLNGAIQYATNQLEEDKP